MFFQYILSFTYNLFNDFKYIGEKNYFKSNVNYRTFENSNSWNKQSSFQTRNKCFGNIGAFYPYQIKGLNKIFFFTGLKTFKILKYLTKNIVVKFKNKIKHKKS